MLSSSERARAKRFRFESDRIRFEAGRVMLRCVLGCYLNQQPASLRFIDDVHGKPRLDSANVTVRFNISHSHDIVLCAVASPHDVGVDVEFVRDGVDWTSIASTIFENAECQRLRELPREHVALAFFDFWVQTEALLKAEGVGLTGTLPTVAPDRWTVWPLEIETGYRAAVAVEPSTNQVMCFEWSRTEHQLELFDD